MSTKSSSNTRRLFIACGGTGGHFFPGVAIARALEELGDTTCLLILSEKEVDHKMAASYPEFTSVFLPAVAMPRAVSLDWIKFLVKFFSSYLHAKKSLQEKEVQAVISMGGFTSFPVALAAFHKKIPVFLHDSNAVPGRSNILIARFCRHIFLGFAEAKKKFPQKNKCFHFLGTPTRENLSTQEFNKISQKKALEFFGLNTDAFFKNKSQNICLLIVGGSQGARNLNNIVLTQIAELKRCGVFVIHLCGRGDFSRSSEIFLQNVDKAKKEEENVGNGYYHLRAFCTQMDLAYAAADIVLARAGASTLSELSQLGKPSILVPYPHASDDHQYFNAKVFADADAALLIREEKLERDTLLATLSSLLNTEKETLQFSKQKLSAMAKQSRNLALPNSAKHISAKIADILANKP